METERIFFTKTFVAHGEGPDQNELACGTGRAAVPLAEAGYQVHGLDASHDMLAVGAAKKRKMAPDARERLFLTTGYMRDFTFSLQFGGIYSTFRSFQNLLTPEDRETCLRCIHRHFRSDGLLVLNLFDPRYDPAPFWISGGGRVFGFRKVAPGLRQRTGLGRSEEWLRAPTARATNVALELQALSLEYGHPVRCARQNRYRHQRRTIRR
jgi:SAM-dependent methyltransferase